MPNKEFTPEGTQQNETGEPTKAMFERLRKIGRIAHESEAFRIARHKQCIAERVDILLKEHLFSRSEFARRLGKSPAYVTKLLAGGENLTIESLVRIGDVLDCDLELKLTPRIAKQITCLRLESHEPTQFWEHLDLDSNSEQVDTTLELIQVFTAPIDETQIEIVRPASNMSLPTFHQCTPLFCLVKQPGKTTPEEECQDFEFYESTPVLAIAS